MGRVQVVQESNDKVNAEDDVFQINELVNAYQVVSSIILGKKNQIFMLLGIFLLMLIHGKKDPYLFRDKLKKRSMILLKAHMEIQLRHV